MDQLIRSEPLLSHDVSDIVSSYGIPDVILVSGLRVIISFPVRSSDLQHEYHLKRVKGRLKRLYHDATGTLKPARQLENWLETRR